MGVLLVIGGCAIDQLRIGIASSQGWRPFFFTTFAPTPRAPNQTISE
jgi:hypothetical protein